MGIAITAALLLAAFSALPAPAAAQIQVTGPVADEITFIEITDEAIALNDLAADGHDIRLDSVRGREAQAAAVASADLKTPRGTSAFWNLKLNPVPRSDGKLNPMSIREIREAMNWLVDREFIADEIYGGLGFPHIVLFHPKEPDYGRLAGFIAGVEAKYGYDPERAEAVITQAMTDAGATKVDGKWQHGGEAVTITFVIRTSPTPRTRYGELIAGLMEDLGFTVVRDFKTGAQASPIVYSGTASDGLWQMYTEGWGSTAMTLWSQFRGYQMFQWPAYSTIWDEHSLDAVTDQAISDWFLQDFATPEEREELIKTAIEGTIRDSTRTWLVAEESMFVHRAEVQLVQGLAAGLNEMYTLRSARRDAPWDGKLTVSQFEGFVGGWNPIGITWLFDRNIENTYRDGLTLSGGVWPNPHTGSMLPFRASEWEIETNGTDGSVPIPSDAMVWNMTAKKWDQVGSGQTTQSKVTFTYEMGNWHHGMPITMQDILANYAATYRLEHPDGDAYNESHEGQFSFFQSIFNGLRVIGNMSWPLIDRLNVSNEIEVYVDFWHWDEGEIAGSADVFTSTPWEVWEVMLKTYADGDGAAFLEEDAEEKDWEWMNQAFGPSVPLLKPNFDDLRNADTVPMSLTGLIGSGNVTARYDALNDWYAAHQADGNAFLVSNGPFYLKSVDVPTKTVVVVADRANYPLPPSMWDTLLRPRIPKVTLGPPQTINLDVGASFGISVTLFGEPYDDVTQNFIVLDPATATVLFEGDTARVGPGSYEARLTAAQTQTLVPGAYEIRVITVGADAAPPVIIKQSFLAFTVAGVLETLIKDTETALRTDLGTVTSRLDDVDTANTALASDVAGLSTLVTVVLVLAVVAIATSAITALVLIRRIPPST